MQRASNIKPVDVRFEWKPCMKYGLPKPTHCTVLYLDVFTCPIAIRDLREQIQVENFISKVSYVEDFLVDDDILHHILQCQNADTQFLLGGFIPVQKCEAGVRPRLDESGRQHCALPRFKLFATLKDQCRSDQYSAEKR